MGFEFMTLLIMRGESDWKYICELRKSLTNLKICALKKKKNLEYNIRA